MPYSRRGSPPLVEPTFLMSPELPGRVFPTSTTWEAQSVIDSIQLMFYLRHGSLSLYMFNFSIFCNFYVFTELLNI